MAKSKNRPIKTVIMYVVSAYLVILVSPDLLGDVSDEYWSTFKRIVPHIASAYDKIASLFGSLTFTREEVDKLVESIDLIRTYDDTRRKARSELVNLIKDPTATPNMLFIKLVAIADDKVISLAAKRGKATHGKELPNSQPLRAISKTASMVINPRRN